jgi:Mlc titration factor MtfA (ptsG expression regulator)
MIFSWLRSRRRRRLLEAAFPEEWEQTLQRRVWQVALLSEEQQARLRRLMQVFIAEKNWEGCNGLTLTVEMQVVIAAYACLLVVGLDAEEHFDHVQSILVYPAGYVGKNVQDLGGGLILEGEQARIGEAWYRGPVILSWSDIHLTTQGQIPGRNVVFHEFAHQLDMLNGRSVDGTPPIPSAELQDRWKSVLGDEFRELSRSCHLGEQTFLDCYGSTSLAEFFAVATESFFELPRQFRYFHTELYSVLSRFYQQDPARQAMQSTDYDS